MPATPRSSPILTFGILCWLTTAASADEILLFDDFAGPEPDGGIWGLATWNIGDRTQFGNSPNFSIDGEIDFISLPLDTYNPGDPGQPARAEVSRIPPAS